MTLTFLRLGTALLEDVELAVSELVTNAVEYGHDSVVLRLRCNDGEPNDLVHLPRPRPGPRMAAPRHPGDHHGHGLGPAGTTSLSSVQAIQEKEVPRVHRHP